MTAGLEAVLNDCRPRLVRFLQLRGAADQAEDMVQEVWLRAASADGTPISNPEAYLFRIAHNVMIDWHRSERQRGRREREWSETQAGETLETSPEPNAEQASVARSVLAKVVAEIDGLGEPTATIFRRFRIDGVPQREIAAQFGVSLPTVEKHLQKAYRAMAALRETMDMG
jgi:RNA polymerase sigma-70 factor (ECF subfamily)